MIFFSVNDESEIKIVLQNLFVEFICQGRLPKNLIIFY
jgi:hypothetical protein